MFNKLKDLFSSHRSHKSSKSKPPKTDRQKSNSSTATTTSNATSNTSSTTFSSSSSTYAPLSIPSITVTEDTDRDTDPVLLFIPPSTHHNNHPPPPHQLSQPTIEPYRTLSEHPFQPPPPTTLNRQLLRAPPEPQTKVYRQACARARLREEVLRMRSEGIERRRRLELEMRARDEQCVYLAQGGM